jgi:hypothetical protein
MNRINRYKRIVLLLGCGLAGMFASAYPGEAASQTQVPLKVDPALLGLPPATTARPDVVAERRSAVETRSVAPEVPEIQPLAPPSPEKTGIDDETGILAPKEREASFVRQDAPASESVHAETPVSDEKREDPGVPAVREPDRGHAPASFAPVSSPVPGTTVFIAEPSPSLLVKETPPPTRRSPMREPRVPSRHCPCVRRRQ